MSSESSCWNSSVNAKHSVFSVMMCANVAGSGAPPSSASSSRRTARFVSRYRFGRFSSV